MSEQQLDSKFQLDLDPINNDLHKRKILVAKHFHTLSQFHSSVEKLFQYILKMGPDTYQRGHRQPVFRFFELKEGKKKKLIIF